MRFSVALFFVLAVSGCTQGKKELNAVPQTPRSLMVSVAKQAQTCWFKTKDPAFRSFKLAIELNSFSNKPRILIVPKNKPTGLPKLVALAERQSGKLSFSTFGPLLQGSDGTRINASLNRWARGSKSC